MKKNTFGNCAKLNNNPCQVTITAWSVTLEDNQGKVLLEDSKATCPIGSKDCITIINHGQIAKPTEQNVKNTRPEVVNELCPFIEFGEKKKVPHLLNLKSKE